MTEPLSSVRVVPLPLPCAVRFVNLFALLKKHDAFLPLPAVELYLSLTSQLSQRLSSALQSSERLYLTRPSFFSRIGSAAAATTHDEYWHPHIDREQYGVFEATALIYLSEHGGDFDGGEFVFVDSATPHTAAEQRQVEVAMMENADSRTKAAESSTAAARHTEEVDEDREWIIRPSLGAVTFFSSGAENVHYVRRVTSGTRYALTIAFTRNEEESVEAALDKLYGQRIAAWHASGSAALDESEG